MGLRSVKGRVQGVAAACQRLRGERQGRPLLPLTPLVLSSLSLSSLLLVYFLSVSLCARVRVVRVWCVLVTGDMEFEDSLSMGTA